MLGREERYEHRKYNALRVTQLLREMSFYEKNVVVECKFKSLQKQVETNIINALQPTLTNYTFPCR